jgi:hypothetical protein
VAGEALVHQVLHRAGRVLPVGAAERRRLEALEVPVVLVVAVVRLRAGVARLVAADAAVLEGAAGRRRWCRNTAA